MLLHVDQNKFKSKPTGPEIGGIKHRLTSPDSIKDLTIQEIANVLASGQTVQPGVTPFSDESRAMGRKGTVKEDFTEQTLFMVDIDNKRTDISLETPEHAAGVLAMHNLRTAFMYPTFGSKQDSTRFRIALVCDTPVTDKGERDRIQSGLISLFPQADADCTNADRIFFGTDKGFISTDPDAVCSFADLLAIAAQEAPMSKCGRTIPEGQRHKTLLSFAVSILKKYGISDTAYNEYLRRVGDCEAPIPEEELNRIWNDACRFYETTIASSPDNVQPDEFADLDSSEKLEPSDYTDVGQANVFTAVYGYRCRYSAATKWLVYDGKKWNESELKAQGLAQQLTDRQLEEARNKLLQAQQDEEEALESGDDKNAKKAHAMIEAAKKYRSFVLGRRKTNRIAATLIEARPTLEIAVQDLDNDPFLLNTPDGTVDLRTGVMRPHDPNDYCTKMTTVSPSSDGAEIWHSFLDRISCGDRSLQVYHQI